MRNLLGAIAGSVFGIAAFAGSVNAATVVEANCVSVTHVNGCLFNGNINSSNSGGNSYLLAEAAYNLFNDTHPTAQPDITLNVLFASDDPGFPGSPVGHNTPSGSWSLPGYAVDFVAVKASNQFVLYQFTSPEWTAFWDTLDIPYKNNPHELSHLVFFGTVDTVTGVPEPSTWAMMMMGFGVVGWSLRRSRRQTVAG